MRGIVIVLLLFLLFLSQCIYLCIFQRHPTATTTTADTANDSDNNAPQYIQRETRSRSDNNNRVYKTLETLSLSFSFVYSPLSPKTNNNNNDIV